MAGGRSLTGTELGPYQPVQAVGSPTDKREEWRGADSRGGPKYEHRGTPFVLAAPSRDKKTIHTPLSELFWDPILWDKGLTPPPQLLVCSKQPLRSRPSWRLLLPLCPHTSLFMFSDHALAFTPAIPNARRHPQHNSIRPTIP